MTENPWDNQSRTVMPEASRLTPDILKRIDDDIHGYQTGDWCPDGSAHTTAIILLEEAAQVITALREQAVDALADSGKRIAELQDRLLERQIQLIEIEEQLRAYRGAERIAHDRLEENT